MTRPPRRWLPGFGLQDLDADDRAYADLLTALTRDRVETEALEREMTAPAVQASTDVKQLQREELAEARRELDLFRAALADVRTRAAGDPRAEVPYDSADPKQDAAADVLIQYLVRPGYAEVRTEEQGSEHYIYYVRVDWARLRDLASEHGHPLPE
jgi:uncharacterized protein involved in exopolysaccharide biosynthesis